jgi:acyl carrier protein
MHRVWLIGAAAGRELRGYVRRSGRLRARIDTEKEGSRVEHVVNDYISREIVQDPALLPLSNDTSLLETGILDSLSLLQLVVFLEERFKITVGEADLLPEHFDTVNTICAYLRTQEPGREGAARG